MNKLKVTIPDSQKQQLQQAIVSLLAVLLGIVLTLAGQVVSQGLGITDPAVPAGVLTVQAPELDPIQALGTSHFTDLDVDEDLAVGDDATIAGDLTVTGAAAVTGATTLTGALDANGAADFASTVTIGGLLYPSFTNLTATNGTTITPTYSIYALDSAAAVTITLAASGTEGQLLVLIGDDANDITVADTNLRSNDGSAQVLNAYDVLFLVYQDDEWLEISESNDS